MRLEDFHWYVVQTAPRQEAPAALDLRRRGYTTLYLHTAEWKDRGRRRVLVRQPYLTGYVFVGLRDGQFAGGVPLLHLAANAIGVSRNGVVKSPGGYPLPIPHDAMHMITAGADLISGVVESEKPSDEFAGRVGWKVRLGDMAGAYYGFMGEISRIEPSGKLGILISSFGRKVQTTVGQHQIDELISPKGDTISVGTVQSS